MLGLVKYYALPTYSRQENANLHPDSPNPASQIPHLIMCHATAPCAALNYWSRPRPQCGQPTRALVIRPSMHLHGVTLSFNRNLRVASTAVLPEFFCIRLAWQSVCVSRCRGLHGSFLPMFAWEQPRFLGRTSTLVSC